MIQRWGYHKPKNQFYDDEEYVRATLEKLFVTRHVGSPGHEAVRDFLDKEIMRFGFLSKRHDFFQGRNFSNVVGFANDQARHYLILTCHYDSPSPRKGHSSVPVSATDGAVSCAILLALIKTFKFSTKALGIETGLVVVFFDGHEPLATDPVNKPMLYGSQAFVDTDFIPMESIALVLTLNHIGGADQNFPIYSQNVDKNYLRIVNIEKELWKSGELIDRPVLFQMKRSSKNDPLDDHVPFAKNHVPILHLVATPFPEVWHTPRDNAANLHWPSIRNFNKVFRNFVYHYLQRPTSPVNFRFYRT
ncbi:hypothetical protein KR032_000497 [Drosophila birchii]|nr:hypothetical protein KR032_000497 [Drosophila birchii]